MGFTCWDGASCWGVWRPGGIMSGRVGPSCRPPAGRAGLLQEPPTSCCSAEGLESSDGSGLSASSSMGWAACWDASGWAPASPAASCPSACSLRAAPNCPLDGIGSGWAPPTPDVGVTRPPEEGSSARGFGARDDGNGWALGCRGLPVAGPDAEGWVGSVASELSASLAACASCRRR